VEAHQETRRRKMRVQIELPALRDQGYSEEWVLVGDVIQVGKDVSSGRVNPLGLEDYHV